MSCPLLHLVEITPTSSRHSTHYHFFSLTHSLNTPKDMAGFLLGTGTGLLAGAAVYYTLSTEIAQHTAVLRQECVLSWISLTLG